MRRRTADTTGGATRADIHNWHFGAISQWSRPRCGERYVTGTRGPHVTADVSNGFDLDHRLAEIEANLGLERMKLNDRELHYLRQRLTMPEHREALDRHLCRELPRAALGAAYDDIVHESPPERVDLAHLKELNRRLYTAWDDPRPGAHRWAGRMADENRSEARLAPLLAQLRRENLAGMSGRHVADRLGFYVIELYKSPSFHFGPNLTYRALVSQVARAAGQPISWERAARVRVPQGFHPDGYRMMRLTLQFGITGKFSPKESPDAALDELDNALSDQISVDERALRGETAEPKSETVERRARIVRMRRELPGKYTSVPAGREPALGRDRGRAKDEGRDLPGPQERGAR